MSSVPQVAVAESFGAETDVERFERDLTIAPILNQIAAWGMAAEAHLVAGGHRLASLVAVGVKPRNVRMTLRKIADL